MMQFLQTEQAAIIQQYAEGNPKLDYDDNEIPLSKALGDLMFGCAGKLRSLEASIGAMVGTQAKIMTDFAKIAQKEHELSPVDSLTALSIRKRIMDDMDKKGWTALQAAREFERHGIKVPESILEEAKREISEYEPPIDDSGISDDELDRQTAEYLAEQQQFHDVWLPQRQAELANIIDTEVEDEVINDDELELDEGEWDDDEGMDLSDFDGDED
ncbi:hypothetical protein JCM19237_280 [Photobacterium aphoticum]|uniref:Uncharacterized protein n=1 Tax=Photobacterium aphoticum TaxID=754436 RepID=A0A090QXG7_9GAMM|nr:hypothetical protein JCM19237_280 [Photobacterium aphoticum]